MNSVEQGKPAVETPSAVCNFGIAELELTEENDIS